MRRPFLILLSAAIGIAVAIGLVLPPPAVRLQPAISNVVAGAFHVHTNRSDGSGSMDDVAAAARRAGLQFVIFTDHGNGTRVPEPPAYRAGVLTLDGVEISTAGGHYAVVGMPQAPYPLAGEPRDVAEDVRRLGGFGIVAHPDSPRSELQWTDWSAAVDGLEWLSLDSAWRRASSRRLAEASIAYWFRRPESVASILARPHDLLSRFDALAHTTPTIALASTDAHGLWLPSYEACFRTMTTRIEIRTPLTGDAVADGATILAALKAGHHYSAIDAFATPPSFEFVGYVEAGEGEPAHQGDRLAPDGRAILQVRAAGAEGATLVLFRNGEPVREGRAQTMIHQTDGRAGAYRAEVRLPGFDVPWLVSNPIYVGPAHVAPAAPPRTPREAVDVAGFEPRRWNVDHDARSMAHIERSSGGVRFQYQLGPGQPRQQFASMSVLVPDDLSRFDRVSIDAQASRPLRMSVQLIQDAGGRWLRWQRSVYLDRTRRSVTVFFDDMRPAPPLTAVDALVFLVDTNNTSPGTSGEIIFDSVVYQR